MKKSKIKSSTRSLAKLRKEGYLAQSVEKWIPQVKRTVDLFNLIDVIAVRSEPEPTILGVQACIGRGDVAKHIKKALEEPKLKLWLAAGGQFEIWSWAKRGPRGKVKHWTVKKTLLFLDDQKLVQVYQEEIIEDA